MKGVEWVGGGDMLSFFLDWSIFFIAIETITPLSLIRIETKLVG